MIGWKRTLPADSPPWQWGPVGSVRVGIRPWAPGLQILAFPHATYTSTDCDQNCQTVKDFPDELGTHSCLMGNWAPGYWGEHFLKTALSAGESEVQEEEVARIPVEVFGFHRTERNPGSFFGKRAVWRLWESGVCPHTLPPCLWWFQSSIVSCSHGAYDSPPLL